MIRVGQNAFDWCDRLARAEFRGSAEQWTYVRVEIGNNALADIVPTAAG